MIVPDNNSINKIALVFVLLASAGNVHSHEGLAILVQVFVNFFHVIAAIITVILSLIVFVYRKMNKMEIVYWKYLVFMPVVYIVSFFVMLFIWSSVVK